MRAVSVIFWRNAKFGDSLLNALRQAGELMPSVNADPEYSRSLRRREKSMSPNANFEPGRFNSPQSVGDVVDFRWRLFSDEF
jgi:hypothetical protein